MIYAGMSGKLENLRQLLMQGYTPRDLVIQGYPKSSVHKAADQVRRRGSSRVSHIGAQADGIFLVLEPSVLQSEPSEPQGTTEHQAELDELACRRTRQIENEDEWRRTEREESHKAVMAEDRARRERDKRLRARRLFNDALKAHREGKIDNYQLIALTSHRETKDDIESGENCLRALVADASARR
jgi:hypothetical protein